MKTETPPLAEAAGAARSSREQLATAIVHARDVEHQTWRTISAAVGMTEQGVAKIYRRTTERTPA
jgi:hypothetical protein